MSKDAHGKIGKDIKVAFVCTGNTCRSCMAEGIFRAVAKQAENEKLQNTKDGNKQDGDQMMFSAMSRGIYAYEGDQATVHSIQALKSLWNIDISLHRAKLLSQKDIEEADIILTMTRQHRDTLQHHFIESKDKIFTLKEYVLSDINKDDATLDITDPFGMPYQRYESCAHEIYDCVLSVFKLLN